MTESGHTNCLDYPISIFIVLMDAHNKLNKKQNDMMDKGNDKSGNILQEDKPKLTPAEYEQNWLKLGGFLNAKH